MRAAVAIVAIAGGLAAARADEPGETMLEALRNRDAQAHWDATAEMLPERSTASPRATAPTPRPLTETEDSVDGWHASDAPVRSAQREPGESATAAQDLPPAPDIYDPPPSDPAAEPEVQDDETGSSPEVRPIARTPEELRDIESILPYADYEPNPNVDDPYLNQCPRPDGAPCKEPGEDGFVPPCPEEMPLGTKPFVGRAFPKSVFAWKASNVTHNPLYFEDVALERYGHTYGPVIQPVVSLGRFSGQVLALPYHMTLDPPCKEMYPLGYYRPGECAPKLLYQPPLNAKAAAVTAGFYTGMGFILP